MTREILIAVQKRIKELYPETIRYVAEDWGQLDYYTDRPPVQFPCVLIDIEEAEYTDLTRRVQRVEAILNVRVADVAPSNRSVAAPNSDQQFDLLRLAQQIYTHLQGFSGTTFSGLSRIKLRHERRDDGIKEYLLTFRFGGTDNEAQKKLTEAKDVSAKIDPIVVGHQ